MRKLHFSPFGEKRLQNFDLQPQKSSRLVQASCFERNFVAFPKKIYEKHIAFFVVVLYNIIV